MEFKKMVTITLYAKQIKRHRCTEQTFGLCGRRQGWDVQREQHWNKSTIKGETDHQPRFDAWELRAGALGRPRRMGWGTHVNPWLIHVNVWQKPLQYYKVISLQLIKIIEGGVKLMETVRKVMARGYGRNRERLMEEYKFSAINE